MGQSPSDLTGASELGGVRARFASLAARWALDAVAAAGLLGRDGDWTGRSLVEVVADLDARAETCLRLACDVDRLLSRAISDENVAGWLHEPGVDCEDEFCTPLAILSTGPAALRALRRYLEDLPPGSRPRDTPANDR